MTTKKISQREAHAMRRELNALKSQRRDQLRSWGSSYTGGKLIASIDVEPTKFERFDMARDLGFTVVASGAYERGKIHLFAVTQ